ncbi:MAG: hypothetical protein NC079_04855 [Clostridium sp.]|nr:hypothetical protein [Acetatifactor muris]MCM1526261.1 hypothetical protein [Bacteroides sp.]MCM1562922.1 hypothetical protein [Clostridium sp.]
MTALYWALEYGKVFAAYMFIMFVWPSVMFRKFLSGKSLTFRFAFCVTFQTVLVNTVVLLLGLIHLLDPLMVRILFYTSLLCSLVKDVKVGEKEYKKFRRVINGTYGIKKLFADALAFVGGKISRQFRKFLDMMQGRWWEYGTLAVVLVYGMIYFSYGAFQDYSYGFGDMYPHNAWIYGLTGGQIFSAGVYPEGMHCFIYALHTLFGIRIYSCLLFTAGIHVLVFLLSAYILLKEVFRWRYTPLLVLTAFLTVDLMCIDEVYSMSRLQWTIPQEFGLFTVFLCAAFLVRYLRLAGPARKPEGGVMAIFFKSYRPLHFEGEIERPPEYTKGFWDENLLVFMLALAASLAIHFYATIMAFFLCAAFVPVALSKIFNTKRLIPLVTAAFCGFMIAVLPMGGALASGIPFQGSIGWAMSVINGTEGASSGSVTPDAGVGDAGANETEAGSGTAGSGAGAVDSGADAETAGATGPTGGAVGGTVQGTEATGNTAQGAAVVPETPVSKPKVSLGQRILGVVARLPEIVADKANRVYKASYVTLYKQERARVIIGCTGLAVGLWFVCRLILTLIRILGKKDVRASRFDGYLSVTLASVFFMTMYGAGSIGLPSLIAGSRLCTVAQMLILAVMMILPDLALSCLQLVLHDEIGGAAGIIGVAGIYLFTILTGSFHGYLYYELTRHNGAVMATYTITDRLPEGSFTIVSTVDELYQVIQYGYHEEAVSFLNGSMREDYTLPTEYVFIFVEKKPLEYAQSHFFTGPKWLAWEKYPAYYGSFVSQCPDITVSEISRAAADGYQGRFPEISSVYSNLEQRTVVESKLYGWCREFERLYPNELHTYYEDDDFICYYFRQNGLSLYQLGIMN